MKKIIVYILTIIFLGITPAEIVMAQTLESSSKDKILISAETADTTKTSTYKQSIIPKSEFLPGPSKEDQPNSKRIFGEKVLPNLAVMLIGFTGGTALVFLVIAGVRFVTAYGNEEAIGSAKKQAMFSIIGFLVALFSYAIVAIITNIKFVDDTTVRTGETGEDTGPTDNIPDDNARNETESLFERSKLTDPNSSESDTLRDSPQTDNPSDNL